MAAASASVRFLMPCWVLNVEFHPMPFLLRVNKTERVRAEAIHVAIAGRDSAIAHDDGDLVKGLGQRGPEIPVVPGATHVGARIALYRMVEVGELERVAQKEDRRVVADQVPVASWQSQGYPARHRLRRVRRQRWNSAGTCRSSCRSRRISCLSYNG